MIAMHLNNCTAKYWPLTIIRDLEKEIYDQLYLQESQHLKGEREESRIFLTRYTTDKT